MDYGWVKLWRKSIDSGLIKNHNAWIFWTYCLMRANHKKDYKQVVGFQEVILQPGQFIFGLKKASEETNLSMQNIRTCLSFLKKCKNLTIKSTNKFSVITIENWGSYQCDDRETNKQTNKQVTNKTGKTNKQVTNKQQTELFNIIENKNENKNNNLKTAKNQQTKRQNLTTNKNNIQEEQETHIGELKSSPPDKCPQIKIRELYNKILPELPHCKETNKTVEGMVRTRWKEKKERQDLIWWENYFNGIRESDFLMGRLNNKTFNATFEWLVRPTNMSKVLNGNYRNKKKQQPNWKKAF